MRGVVGHEEHPERRTLAPHGLDAVGHDAQRVDVEAGVGLVEHGQLGVEHGHLQDLVALLLTAGEALVQVALAEGGVHAEALHPFEHRHADLEHRAVVADAPRHRLAQELDHRDAGDLLGVLEGEEHPGLGPHVGRPRRDVLAPEADGARGDLVGGVPEQRAGQRRLARAVRAHQGVELALAHGQVDAAQDLGVRRRPRAGPRSRAAGSRRQSTVAARFSLRP